MNRICKKQLEVRGQHSGVAWGWRSEDFGPGEHSLECVGEGGGEFGSEKVDIQLKVGASVAAVDDERTAALVRSGHQVERELPGRLAGN